MTAGGGTRRSGSVRVLMLMHVDWNWIRQRPQALAEELDRMPDIRLRVAYLPNWRRGRLSKNASPVRRLPIPQLPFARFRLVRALNRIAGRAFVAALVRLWRPDVVVLPHPDMAAVLPSGPDGPRIAYDCMDLAAGFADTAAEAERLNRVEDALLERSDVVFAPSAWLVDHLRARTPADRPVVLVRNGYGGGLEQVRQAPPAGPLKLGYFGTISAWFDTDTIGRALAEDPELEMHLWGPMERPVAALDRLVVHPPVPHAELGRLADAVHAFIMPFVLTDLIRCVDPVKLYEYVALGRPVISVYYPELEPFRGLINFYEDADELVALLGRLARDPDALAPDPDRAAAFLAGSTWRARSAVMADALRRLAPRASA